MLNLIYRQSSQLTFIWLKSTIETLEKREIYSKYFGSKILNTYLKMCKQIRASHPTRYLYGGRGHTHCRTGLLYVFILYCGIKEIYTKRKYKYDHNAI